MPGQGAVTTKVATMLSASGWSVIYSCIPNTPHIGVIPIPTKNGIASQRYPDILSVAGPNIRLSEVEIELSQSVAADILERFQEQRESLATAKVYSEWRARVESLHGVELPQEPAIQCELVLCRKIRQNSSREVSLLRDASIMVYDAACFAP